MIILSILGFTSGLDVKLKNLMRGLPVLGGKV
jgi:hypothetical protein